MAKKTTKPNVESADGKLEIKDDDVLVVLRESNKDFLNVFLCTDSIYFKDPTYIKKMYSGALMTALPSFLSSSSENRQIYMDYILINYPEIFEPFLNVIIKNEN